MSLFTTFVMACPNLTGSYLCPNENSEYVIPMTLAQYTSEQGVVVYVRTQNFVETKSYSDGRLETSESETFQGSLKFWCEQQFLKSEQVGNFIEESEIIGSLNSQVSYTLNEQGDFISQGEARMIRFGEPYQINMNSKCVRKP